jgi:very-short-patch-repair endonuclease
MRSMVEGEMALRKNQHDYARARKLRRELSLPEALLWRELRGAPEGMKIRKQHPVGRYVIDFYCAAVKTGFEVDGIAHDMGDRPEKDEERTAFLAEQGIRLVRIPAREVLADPGAIAQAIVDHCRERS